MKLQLAGSIKKIEETVNISDSFKKREFILNIVDGQYEQMIAFEMHQDKGSQLDSFKAGDEVTVFFNIRGREWNNKVLNNLVAWRVSLTESVQTVKVVAHPPESTNKNDGGDLPF